MQALYSACLQKRPDRRGKKEGMYMQRNTQSVRAARPTAAALTSVLERSRARRRRLVQSTAPLAPGAGFFLAFAQLEALKLVAR